MSALFAHEREGDGWPKLALDGPRPPSPKGAFRVRCYANGVTEGADIERLWAAEQARRGAAAPKKRRGRR